MRTPPPPLKQIFFYLFLYLFIYEFDRSIDNTNLHDIHRILNINFGHIQYAFIHLNKYYFIYYLFICSDKYSSFYEEVIRYLFVI